MTILILPDNTISTFFGLLFVFFVGNLSWFSFEILQISFIEIEDKFFQTKFTVWHPWTRLYKLSYHIGNSLRIMYNLYLDCTKRLQATHSEIILFWWFFYNFLKNVVVWHYHLWSHAFENLEIFFRSMCTTCDNRF